MSLQIDTSMTDYFVPSSILELGWDIDTDDTTATIAPFQRPFPDDLMATVCQQLGRDDDMPTLLALQRVNEAVWRAATKFVY